MRRPSSLSLVIGISLASALFAPDVHAKAPLVTPVGGGSYIYCMQGWGTGNDTYLVPSNGVGSLYGAGFYRIPGTDIVIKLGGYLRPDGYQGSIPDFSTVQPSNGNNVDNNYERARNMLLQRWQIPISRYNDFSVPQNSTLPGTTLKVGDFLSGNGTNVDRGFIPILNPFSTTVVPSTFFGDTKIPSMSLNNTDDDNGTRYKFDDFKWRNNLDLKNSYKFNTDQAIIPKVQYSDGIDVLPVVGDLNTDVVDVVRDSNPVVRVFGRLNFDVVDVVGNTNADDVSHCGLCGATCPECGAYDGCPACEEYLEDFFFGPPHYKVEFRGQTDFLQPRVIRPVEQVRASIRRLRLEGQLPTDQVYDGSTNRNFIGYPARQTIYGIGTSLTIDQAAEDFLRMMNTDDPLKSNASADTPAKINLHAQEPALEGEKNQAARSDIEVKIFAPKAGLPVMGGVRRPALDLGFDQDPMQCTPDKMGNCAIIVPAMQRRLYRIGNAAPEYNATLSVPNYTSVFWRETTPSADIQDSVKKNLPNVAADVRVKPKRITIGDVSYLEVMLESRKFNSNIDRWKDYTGQSGNKAAPSAPNKKKTETPPIVRKLADLLSVGSAHAEDAGSPQSDPCRTKLPAAYLSGDPIKIDPSSQPLPSATIYLHRTRAH
jgi:hypothetical protein